MVNYNGIIQKAITILLVEDSESDARLIKEFLKEVNFNSVLHTVNDGIEALDFLYMHCEYDYSPDLVILDLNLPRMNGIEVLKKIKNDDKLKRIPVIVLTTSTATEDIEDCYRNYANCYLVKPADLDEFAKVINSINEFWFNISTLPSII